MNTAERRLEPPKSDVWACPICGAENPEKIYSVPGEGAVGCDECLCAYEPYEYFDRAGGFR